MFPARPPTDSGPHETITLRDLLTPIAPTAFLFDYWSKRALHIPGPDEKKFVSLFSWTEMNRVLNSGSPDLSRLRLARDGRFINRREIAATPGTGLHGSGVDARKVIQHCQDEDATIVIGDVQRDSDRLHALAAQLSIEFGEPIQIYLVASWPGTAGLSLHQDEHDGLVLQVEGSKRWRVSEPTVERPTDGRPYLDIVLSKGDLLYLPKGHWHEAVTETEPSLHLTVSVMCRNGLSLLAWLSERLKVDSRWRASLPLFGTDGTWRDEGSALSAHLTALAQHLAAVASDPATVREYIDDCVRRATSAAPYQFPEQVIPEAVMQLTTVLTRPPGQPYLLKPLPDNGVLIEVWGHRLTFSGHLGALGEIIFSRHAFTAQEVLNACPLVRWSTLRSYLIELVRAGVLFVASPDGDAGSVSRSPVAPESGACPSPK